MSSFLQRIRESLFHVYDRKDLRRWEGDPKNELPIYGVYHVMIRHWMGAIGEKADR